MMKGTLSLGILAAAFVATSLPAATFTVGLPATTNIGSCDPFGCPTAFGLGTYQQVYASTAFPSGQHTIAALAFYDTQTVNNGKKAEGTYTVSLSYTAKQVGGLDLTNPANNIGAGSQVFFNGTLPRLRSTSSGTTLVLRGTPFTYDPANGNLLLTVTVSSPVDRSPELYLDFANSTKVTSNAYFGSFGNGGNTTGGLVTAFAFR